MKIILSDFDNTLVKDNQIERLIIQKINEFRKENLFILATGRSKDSLKSLQNKLQFNSFDYAICSNGSCIIDNNYNVIFIEFLIGREVRLLFKKLQGNFNESIIVARINGEYIGSIEKYLAINNNDICGITINLNNLSCEIKELIYQHCVKYRWSYQENGDYLKLSPKNTNKYDSFIKLKNSKNFTCSDDDIYAIGDGLNDIELLMRVDNSFTFIDSPIAVKSAAHYILDDYLSIFKFISK